MGVVMATIALLLTATLITEGAGMLFHVLLQDRNEQTTCFDLFISSSGRDSTRFDEYLKKCADKNSGYSVFNESGKVVYTLKSSGKKSVDAIAREVDVYKRQP